MTDFLVKFLKPKNKDRGCSFISPQDIVSQGIVRELATLEPGNFRVIAFGRFGEMQIVHGE